MPNFPIVFLPGDVVQPHADAGQGFSVKRLEYIELEALSGAVGGGDIVARTPDPQARRFEYKTFLHRDLKKYQEGEPLQNTLSLAQFKALIEGLIYGHLILKVYDLRVFDFTVPNQLRYFGVLTNRQGRVFGGTDPETLVFSAANSIDFSDLEQANNTTRNTDTGFGALELLKGFKQKIQQHNMWHPDRILWMKLLDKLFDIPSSVSVNLNLLRDGWRQVGPITLRTGITTDQLPYTPLYFPVYEEGYLRRALTALSGAVTPIENALQLTVNNNLAGRILMPHPGSVGDQDPLLLGAGNLETQDIPDRIQVRINYNQLRPHIQNLVNPIRSIPRAVHLVSEESPFSFPDIIRIPIQHDGFIAIEGFGGTTSNMFGQRFLERMRGKGVLSLSSLPEGMNPPCLVNNQTGHYFVDSDGASHFYYVETYGAEASEELRLLGYILWSVFDNSAEIRDDGNIITIRGKEALRHTGERFEISSNLQCEWPNPRLKAATLQRLAGVLEKRDIPLLFKEAVNHWLTTGFSERIEPQQSNYDPIKVGAYRWYINTL